MYETLQYLLINNHLQHMRKSKMLRMTKLDRPFMIITLVYYVTN